MEIEKGWKIICRDTRESVVIGRGVFFKGAEWNKTKVHYKKREWKRPRRGCGPLTVFSRKSYARTFCSKQLLRHDGDYMQIVPCEFVRQKHISEERSIWNVAGEGWKQEYLPKGTVLARQVRCLL